MLLIFIHTELIVESLSYTTTFIDSTLKTYSNVVISIIIEYKAMVMFKNGEKNVLML